MPGQGERRLERGRAAEGRMWGQGQGVGVRTPGRGQGLAAEVRTQVQGLPPEVHTQEPGLAGVERTLGAEARTLGLVGRTGVLEAAPGANTRTRLRGQRPEESRTLRLQAPRRRAQVG